MPEPKSALSKCIFIGGCSRSGTTFLGSLLGNAEGAVTTPESQFKGDVYRAVRRGQLAGDASEILEAIGRHWRFRLWGSPLPSGLEGVDADVASVVLETVKAYAVTNGRPAPICWIDHSPDNTRHAPWLLESFPGPRIVHLVRDGRGVAASLTQMDRGPNSAIKAAKLWVHTVGIGLAMESAFPERVARVTYETLVREPEETIRGICEFTNLAYLPRMLKGDGFTVPEYTREHHELVGTPPSTVRADRWRDTLKSREIESFESIAGPMLEALGYELLFDRSAAPPTFREKLAALNQDHLWGWVRSRYRYWRRRRRADT